MDDAYKAYVTAAEPEELRSVFVGVGWEAEDVRFFDQEGGVYRLTKAC